jgi:hypothetical protein
LDFDTQRQALVVPWTAAVDFTRGVLSGAELMEAGSVFPPINE